MKLRIRETYQKIEYTSTESSIYNFYNFKILESVKYIVLYSDALIPVF